MAETTQSADLPHKLRLAVLLSGSGTSLENLFEQVLDE